MKPLGGLDELSAVFAPKETPSRAPSEVPAARSELDDLELRVRERRHGLPGARGPVDHRRARREDGPTRMTLLSCGQSAGSGKLMAPMREAMQKPNLKRILER